MSEQRSGGPTSTGTTTETAKEVAGEAVAKAGAVVEEAKIQVRDLVSQAGGELRAQGDAQTERIAEGLRTLASQVQALLDGRTEEAGPLPDLARQATDRLQTWADRFHGSGVQGVGGDVQTFARRRPGSFLAGAAALGFAAGRLLRGAQAAGSASSTATPSTTTSVPPRQVDPFAGTTPDDVVVLDPVEPADAAPIPGAVR